MARNWPSYSGRLFRTDGQCHRRVALLFHPRPGSAKLLSRRRQAGSCLLLFHPKSQFSEFLLGSNQERKILLLFNPGTRHPEPMLSGFLGGVAADHLSLENLVRIHDPLWINQALDILHQRQSNRVALIDQGATLLDADPMFG